MTLATKSSSFTPVDDAITFIRNIDWTKQWARARAGLNNCGLVIAVLAEKLHDFGIYLAKV